jgi:large subunit ribosomal protein L2
MSIRIAKPTGNARRQLSFVKFDVTKDRPEKALSYGKKRISGRNSYGRITVRNRGGGSKRLFREVDLSRIAMSGKPAKVLSLQYDPNRSANIALVEYEDGQRSYLLSPEKLKPGMSVVCSEKTAVRVGNRMKLKNIPPSSEVFNIELVGQHGGQIARSAGSAAILLGVDGDFAQIRMPSGEVRKVSCECYATIGNVSNQDHSKEMIGKAGRKRSFGRRPHVRGKARNPVDHPHGGGEGGTSIGMPHPKTPWGMPALGHKTRRKKNKSSKLILQKRK